MKPQITKEAFIEFCERKPPSELFYIYNPYTCAVGQFAKSLGFPGSTSAFSINTGDRGLPIPGVWEIMSSMDSSKPYISFGELAKRLRGA